MYHLNIEVFLMMYFMKVLLFLRMKKILDIKLQQKKKHYAIHYIQNILLDL